MDPLFAALVSILSIQYIGYLMLGVAVGLLVAILPGLGGTAGLALVLPFIYGMDQTAALALMVGLLAVTSTGDTFPSVLMGIPGSSSAQATVLDGFPLAKQGKAAMALSAAFSASLIGGIFGALVLTMGMYIARPLILATGLAEQMLLIVLALTMVGMLTGRSVTKGLAACGIGLLIGSIGSAPATGELRFTFSSLYLSDGIPLVALTLGVFAVPEIVDLLRSRAAITSKGRLGTGWALGFRATWEHKWLVLRCSGIGCLIGALPGLGGSVIDWIAYGHAVQTSKDRSQFGKGDIRGVIAPESANNAKEGGAFFPTLFFGIPGSSSTALLLGGFILIGIRPGANMVTTDIHITYLIIWSLALANIAATLICIMISSSVAAITRVNYSYLGPAIIALLVFTSFQATVSWGDIFAFLAASAFGIYMKRFGWPRPALVIGFVLSGGLEAALYRTVQIYGFDFLQRPQSILLLSLIILSLYVGYRSIGTVSSQSATPRTTATYASRLPQLVFSSIILATLVYGAYVSIEMRYLSRIFPIWVAGITAALVVALIFQQLTSDASHPALSDAEHANVVGDKKRHAAFYFGWMLTLVLAVYVLGYPIGSAIFVITFISYEVPKTFVRNVIIGLAVVALLSMLSYWLHLSYPPSLLAAHVDLPWWLGG